VDFQLKGASDASFASCPLTLRSTTGYIFTLAGGPVCWSSQRQAAVTTSVCEAEFVALDEAAKVCTWIRNTLMRLFKERKEPTPIGVDNSAAVALIRKPQQHTKTRHVKVAFSHVKEMVEAGNIVVVKVPGDEQPADFLTKALGGQELDMAKDLVGLAPPWV